MIDKKPVRFRCKDDAISVRDLSRYLYSVDVIYTILTLRKENQEVDSYYFKKRLPEEDALKISRISMSSPLFIDIIAPYANWENFKFLVELLGVVFTLRGAWRSLRPKERRVAIAEEIYEKISIKVSPTDPLVTEISKLTRRKLSFEKVEE